MSQSENDIRRRKSGNANKKHQQEITNGYSSHHDAKVEEQKTILPEKTTEKEQNNLPRNETLSPSSSQMDDDPQSFTLVKQRNKNRLFNPPPISNGHSPGNYRDYHFKSNGQSSSSYPMCTYAPHNPLPPRFRQQQQQEPPPPKETVFSNSRFQRRRRGGGGGRFPKRSSYPPDFMTYSNDFVPTSEEHEQIQEEIDNQENQSPTDSTEQQDHPTTNGYSSESDIQTGKIHLILSNLSPWSKHKFSSLKVFVALTDMSLIIDLTVLIISPSHTRVFNFHSFRLELVL